MEHCIGLGGGVEGAAHGAVVVEEVRHGGGGGAAEATHIGRDLQSG